MKNIFKRFGALLLCGALAVTMCGCNTASETSGEEFSAEVSSEAPEPAVSSAESSSSPAASKPAASKPAESKPAESKPADNTSVTDLVDKSDEYRRRTLSDGDMATAESLSDEDDALLEEFSLSLGAPASTVKERDWDKYTSPSITVNFTDEEKQLFKRFDEMAMNLLKNSSVNATYAQKSKRYLTPKVKYSDLGISRQTAMDMAIWFIYTNPKYYFLENFFYGNEDTITWGVYDIFANGEQRAATTNKLFDVIDEWAASVSDDEVTTYQKELSANELICGHVTYDNTVPYNQSVYSFVLGNKRALCAAYSEAFSLVMNSVGVDTLVAVSQCHAWNIIKLDNGKWYGVDTTWNDTGDNPKNLHDYFNCNESDMHRNDSPSTNAHTYMDDTIDRWLPDLDVKNYEPTQYDITGQSGQNSVTALSAPANLRFEYVSDGKVKVTWDAVKGAESYSVELCRDDKPVGSGDVKNNYATLSGIDKTKVYLFKVRACAGSDNQAVRSEWTSVLFRVSSDQSVSAPQNFRVTDRSDGNADVMWDIVPGASKYIVELYFDEEMKTLQNTMDVHGNVLRVLDVAGKNIYLKLCAVYETEKGETKSEWTSLTVNIADESDAPLTPPENLRYELTDEGVKVSWDRTNFGGNKYWATYDVLFFPDADFNKAFLASGNYQGGSYILKYEKIPAGLNEFYAQIIAKRRHNDSDSNKWDVSEPSTIKITL